MFLEIYFSINDLSIVCNTEKGRYFLVLCITAMYFNTLLQVTFACDFQLRDLFIVSAYIHVQVQLNTVRHTYNKINIPNVTDCRYLGITISVKNCDLDLKRQMGKC